MDAKFVISFRPNQHCLICFRLAVDAMGTLIALLSIMLTLVSLQGVTCHGEQPLSRIVIHNAVLALDIHTSIKATPSVLGVKVSSNSFLLQAHVYQSGKTS